MSSKTATVEIQGRDFEVWYDHQPKEHETLTYPGCDESVEITEVFLESVDVTEIISENIMGEFKCHILEFCE